MPDAIAEVNALAEQAMPDARLAMHLAYRRLMDHYMIGLHVASATFDAAVIAGSEKEH